MNKTYLPQIEGLAREFKVVRKTKQFIVDYFVAKQPQVFNSTSDFAAVVKEVPRLGQDDEIQSCKHRVGEPLMTRALNPKYGKEPVPVLLGLKLAEMWEQRHGQGVRSRVVPFACFFSDNCMKSIVLSDFNEELKNCKLAFVDFTRASTRNWSDVELRVLVHYIAAMQKTPNMFIVFNVHPGPLYEKVHLALEAVAADRKLSVHMEYGSYSEQEKDPLAGRFWSSNTQVLLVVGMSKDSNPERS